MWLSHYTNETTPVTVDNLPVKIAESEEERCRIFKYRYELYIEKLGRSSAGAIYKEKILRECFDSRSILLYAETIDNKLAGTVSLLRGPFEEVVKRRIQMNHISAIEPSIDAEKLFYISKFMVSSDQRNASVGNALLLAAFWQSSKLGGVVGFIHCSKAIKRYFLKWGCIEYGQPFEFENLGIQYPLAISTTHENSHITVQSPVLSSGYIFPDDPEADTFFQNLTGYAG